jgi:voltage-gated potassium channel
VEIAGAASGHATDDREALAKRRFEIPMFVAALLVIPVIVIEESSAGYGLKVVGGVLNWLVWSAFLLEALTMLRFSEDRFAWIRLNPLEVAIVVFTPPFLPASLGALRLFRLLRVLGIAVLVREYRRLFSLDGVKGAAVIAGVAALGRGAIFSDVEKGHSMWMACGGRSSR